MLNAVRRNLVAWLALFVALTGTSLAASHYIITSTHQIKPSVLKQLRGRQGPQGPIGPQGVQGLPGTPASEATANFIAKVSVPALNSEVRELRTKLSEVSGRVNSICTGISEAQSDAELSAISEPGRWQAIAEAFTTVKTASGC